MALLIVSEAAGQTPTYLNYSVDEGMPSAEVYDIYQDKEGFIWFATDNGVAKFDGRDIKIFHTRDSLSDPVVFQFFEDVKGRLWFKTYSGKFSYYQNGRIHRYRFNDQTAKTNYLIQSFYCDENENIWFTAGPDIIKIDSSGKFSLRKIPRSQYEFLKIGDGHLAGYSWNSEKINTVVIGDQKFSIKLSPRSEQRSVAPFAYWKNNLYLAIGSDLFCYDGKSLVNVFAGPETILSLTADREDHLWMGLISAGAYRFANPDFRNPWKPEFLERWSVTKIVQDVEGGFWLSTLEKGVYYIPNLAIKNYPLPSQAKIKDVLQVSGNAWIGDQKGNVLSYDLDSVTLKNQFQLSGAILAIFQDSKKKMWVSTINEVNIYDSTGRLRKTIDGAKVEFTENENGDIFSTGGGYITKYSKDAEELKNVRMETFRSILAMDTIILMSKRTGLQVRSAKDLRLITEIPALNNFKITKMIALNDSSIFLCTAGNGFGILRRKSMRFQWFSKKNKFIADDIFDVVQKDSSLIVGTENGVIVMQTRTVLDSIPSIETLSRQSGLLEDQINFLLYGQNSIWAFSDKGLSVIPSAAKFARKTPTFYLKEVFVNQHSRDSVAFENLNYSQNNITISFGFISFNNNQNIITRVRLDPDAQWIYTTERQLEFYSLAPGNYQLHIEYTVDNVTWKNAALDLRFEIFAPFWKRWYFQMAIAVVLAMIGFFYFRNRLALIRQRQQNLEIINQNQQKLLQAEIQTTERERMRIAKDLHDSVGTNMVAFKMLVGQLLRKHHDPNAENIENQLQTIIQEIKEIIYNLSPPGIERHGLFSLLGNLIDRLEKSTSIKINLNIYGEDIENPTLNIVVLRIMQELLSNSMKHSSASKINVFVSIFEDRLNIIYEDNGVGFSQNQIKFGAGLQNIQSRLESIDGLFRFESGGFGVSYTIDIPTNKPDMKKIVT